MAHAATAHQDLDDERLVSGRVRVHLLMIWHGPDVADVFKSSRTRNRDCAAKERLLTQLLARLHHIYLRVFWRGTLPVQLEARYVQATQGCSSKFALHVPSSRIVHCKTCQGASRSV